MGDEAFKTHPVGTGPFMFESYTPQNSVVLTANDDYFRGAPKLGGVEVRYMADPSSRELGLQAGELDARRGHQRGAVGRSHQRRGEPDRRCLRRRARPSGSTSM